MAVPKSYPDLYQIVDYPTAGNPPAGTVWLLRTTSGWVEKRSDGTTLRLSPDLTYAHDSTSMAPLSHAAIAGIVKTQDASIASAIAEWSSARDYKKDQIVIRNKTFFLCLADNKNKDPLSDTSGAWSVFTPGSVTDIFANRSPVATDVHPSGVKWWDTSFGASTPLGYVSLGAGAWQYLTQITLSRVRFHVYGTNSTYQSNLNGIKFFKKDGTQMPNGWWVWGARAGLGGQNAGTNYTGQGITAQYNASGWAELEPSANFDLGESITKVTGSLGYATCTKVEFFYSNGGSKTFNPGGGNLATCDPAIQGRFGDVVTSVLGETLTAAKLSDANNTDPGRLTGQAFVQAWNVLSQAIADKVTALEAKVTALEARQEVRRSPDLPDFTLEWDIWERVAIDLVAWTITVTEYIRVDQDSAFPIAMRPAQGETPISLPPPSHTNAKTNAQGEFVAPIPGGGEFVYGTSRNGSNNYFTFPPNVYKEAASYYVDANDAVIPLTTMAQTIASDSTALGIGAIAISTDAVAFVVDFYKLDNSKITYKIPLS